MWHPASLVQSWRNMFRPSPERLRFMDELLSRDDCEDHEWRSAFQRQSDTADAKRIASYIEASCAWPHKKLRPSDQLGVLFHGTSDEDMPFGRFRADVRRAFGVPLVYSELEALPRNQQTLAGMIRFILAKRQNTSKRLRK